MFALILGALPALLGFMTSFLPNVIKYYENKQRYAHEVTLAKLQLESKKLGIKHAEFIESIRTVVDEGNSLRHHDSIINSVGWVNTLRATVRPVITYTFFAFFIGIKMLTASLMYVKGYDAFDVLAVVWDAYTISIFGSIVGFWFGTRAMIYVNENFFKQDNK